MKHDKAGNPSSGSGGALNDLGVSSLALLAFLDAGHNFHGIEYGQTMTQALRWILTQQDDKTGRLMFYEKRKCTASYIYGHALAAAVLCKSYTALGGKELKQTAQRAIDYLEQHRNPYLVWRYRPRGNDNDSSVTAWCLQAYLAASEAGLKTNSEAMQLSEKWFLQMIDPVNGVAGYNAQGGRPARSSAAHANKFPRKNTESMTAVCMFFLQQFGRKIEGDRVLSLQADIILRQPMTNEAAATDLYYWYFASLALYQAGGDYWQHWSEGFKSVTLKSQRSDGNFAGSWDPSCVWGKEGGRVYATAITLLTVETPHRFARAVR